MPSPTTSVEGPLMEEDTAKIRKRGCSPSSSASSILHNYRFKKAVLVGKRGGGSSTPVPTWRIMASRSPSISLQISAAGTPRSQSGRSTAGRESQIPQPVSARKLAATLWGLNEVPSPAPEQGRRRRGERVGKQVDSDPSHSPFSERSIQSATSTLQGTRQSPSMSRRISSNTRNGGALDSISNGSLMETESRSRSQSQAATESTAGFRSRLKDVSSALTTSKELLKIISRVWGQEDYQPSSSRSLISALNAELERARLQVKELVREKQSDQNEVNYLLKCFMEEKAAWKGKEKEKIKAAVETIAGELEVERRLRRRSESFSKKLGKELERTKTLLANALKERHHRRLEFSEDEEEEGLDCGKVEDAAKSDDGSTESDLHSIELNIKRIIKGQKSGLASQTTMSTEKLLSNEVLLTGRKSASDGRREQQRSTQLLRSVSNALERGGEHEKYSEYEKQAHRRSCEDDLQGYKTAKGIRDYHTLSGSRLGFNREMGSPARDWGQPWSRDPIMDRSATTEGGTNEARFDSKIARRSKGRADFVHL